METSVAGINIGDAVEAALGRAVVSQLPVHKVVCMIHTYKPERDIGTVTLLGDRRQHGVLAVYDGREKDALVRYSHWTYLPPTPRYTKEDQFNGFQPARIVPDTRLTVQCAKGHTQGAWGSTVYWLHKKGLEYFCGECEGLKHTKVFKARVPTKIVDVIDPEAACHQSPGINHLLGQMMNEDLAGTAVRLPRVWAVIRMNQLPSDGMTIDDPLRIQERITRQDIALKSETHCVIPLTAASRFKIMPGRILVEAPQGAGMIEPCELYGENRLDYSCHMLNKRRVV